MKRIVDFFVKNGVGMMVVCCVCCMVFMGAGCKKLMFEKGGGSSGSDAAGGTISFSISPQSYSQMIDNIYESKTVWGKDMEEIDTNSFILSIYTRQGAVVYEGKYGKRPQKLEVLPGVYEIKFRSQAQKAPAFNNPVFGDEFTMTVLEDSQTDVILMCRQVNSAIKLNFTDNFKKQFPGEGLVVKDTTGRVVYPYTAEEYCYVTPGKVDVLYNNGVSDTLLFRRDIPIQQMLTVNLSYIPASRSVVTKIEKDTIRYWKTENYNAGLKMPTGSYTIAQAKEMIGTRNVMVFGFVFGGDVTQNTVRVRPPFSSRTNLLLAPDMGERNRNNMFAVELPSGDVRDALNLVDHRNLLGCAIVVTGNVVENYFGYPGIKSTKEGAVLY